MVKCKTPNLSPVFAALSDPIRRSMIERLSQQSMTIEKLSPTYTISLPAISKHLKVLEKADLIIRQKEGKRVRVILKKKTLKSAQEWFKHYEKFWNQQFDQLEKHLST